MQTIPTAIKKTTANRQPDHSPAVPDMTCPVSEAPAVTFRVVGCSHHRTSQRIRERLVFSEQQIPPLLDRFYDQFPLAESVLLSTCNRTEFYVAAKLPHQCPSHREMMDVLAAERGLYRTEIESELFAFSGDQAIRHLFNVTASLDSMVVGDAQVLSQVKRAYQLAVAGNRSMPLTHHLFQTAIRVARRISNETKLHARRVSIPSVAIGELACKKFDRWDDKHILIIGAGRMAQESLKSVAQIGGRQIVVINRTYSSAKSLAKKWNVRACPWKNLAAELTNADLVISTTGASHPVVTAEMFDSAFDSPHQSPNQKQGRKQKPLVILDLAMPGDFSVEIGELAHVDLLTLNDLSTLNDLQQEGKPSQRFEFNQLPDAGEIIDQEAGRFWKEIKRRSNGATISRLKQQTDLVKSVELSRLMNRLDGLDPRHRAEIEQSFNRLVNKILHRPLKSLHDDTSDGPGLLVDALRKLFQLEE